MLKQLIILIIIIALVIYFTGIDTSSLTSSFQGWTSSKS